MELAFEKEFIGNIDQGTVVSNNLKKAIFTRFIRIHPITFKNRISLRAEFHGCKPGMKFCDEYVSECGQ